MSSNIVNLFDLAAVVLLPKEPDTSFLGKAKEETATELLEPSGSHVSEMEMAELNIRILRFRGIGVLSEWWCQRSRWNGMR